MLLLQPRQLMRHTRMARTHAERAERDINVDENGNSDQTRTTRTRGSSEVCAVVNEAVRHTCSVAMVRSKSTPWKSILIRGTVAAEGSGPRPGKGHGVSMIDTAISQGKGTLARFV